MIRKIISLVGATLIALCIATAAISEQGGSGGSGSAVPTIEARMTPDSVGIGDRMTLSIDVEKDLMQVVAFPDFDLNEQSEIELVGVPTLDTVSIEGRRVKIRRSYTFTSFEAGNYNLGRLSVLYADKNISDTLYCADSLRFFVNTFLIDSTSHAIFDIKPVRDMPFKFEEISGYATWTAIGVVLLIALIIGIIRLMAYFGRPVFGLFKPAPPVPPHVAAYAALEELKRERLWQEGEYKGYYSKLTDILRTYISGRYGVAAMEMTSVEIIAASRGLELPKRCEMEMQELLRDADLVKFAKAEYDAGVNERYFESVTSFVNLTKIEEEIEVSEEGLEVSEEEIEVSEATDIVEDQK